MNNDVRFGLGRKKPQDSPCRLVQFEGELRPDHVEALDGLAGGQDAHLLVDCVRVTRYADHALEALADFEKRVMRAGGKVLLVGVQHPTLQTGVLLAPTEADRYRATA